MMDARTIDIALMDCLVKMDFASLERDNLVRERSTVVGINIAKDSLIDLVKLFLHLEILVCRLDLNVNLELDVLPLVLV